MSMFFDPQFKTIEIDFSFIEEVVLRKSGISYLLGPCQYCLEFRNEEYPEVYPASSVTRDGYTLCFQCYLEHVDEEAGELSQAPARPQFARLEHDVLRKILETVISDERNHEVLNNAAAIANGFSDRALGFKHFSDVIYDLAMKSLKANEIILQARINNLLERLERLNRCAWCGSEEPYAVDSFDGGETPVALCKEHYKQWIQEGYLG